MSKDDLRFGDRGGGSGPPQDPAEKMEMLVEVALQGLVLLVILYVLLAVLDALFFNGAIPLV